MYTLFVWLHLIGLFGFIMAHGVSAGASFALRRERNPDTIRALLNLSSSSLSVFYGSILLLLVAGVVNGFIGKWWGSLWIWISLVLFLAIIFYMSFSPSRYYARVRKAVGLPYMEGTKLRPAQDPAAPEEIDALLNRSQPVLFTIIGFGGLVIISALMVFKPF